MNRKCQPNAPPTVLAVNLKQVRKWDEIKVEILVVQRHLPFRVMWGDVNMPL